MTAKKRILAELEKLPPGEWLQKPEDMPRGTWCRTLTDLKIDGLVETRNPAQGGGVQLRVPEGGESVKSVFREVKATIAERKARILGLLEAADGGFVSRPDDMKHGDWHYAIDRLQIEGHPIVGGAGKGYRLERDKPVDNIDTEVAPPAVGKSAANLSGFFPGPESAPEPQTTTEPDKAPEAPETGSGAVRQATPGEALPPCEESSYPPDAVPLDHWQSPNETAEHAEPCPDDSGPAWGPWGRLPGFAGADVSTQLGEPVRAEVRILEAPAFVDGEICAMDMVQHALEPLDEAARERVLSWAAARYVPDVQAWLTKAS